MQNPVPQRPVDQPRRSSSATVFLAGILLLMAAMTLLALPTGFIGPVIVFGGMVFFGVIGFHYFVWGRWLSEIVRQEAEEQAAQEQVAHGAESRGAQVPSETD